MSNNRVNRTAKSQTPVNSEPPEDTTEKKIPEETNVKIKETPIKQRTALNAPKFSTSSSDIEKEIADAIADEDKTNEQAEINNSQKDPDDNDNSMSDYIFVDIKKDNDLSTKEIQKNSEKNITHQLQPDDLNYNSTSRLKFYTDLAYNLFSEIYNIQISDLLYKSYKAVFPNKDVAIINELIDAAKTGNALTDDTICRLVNLDTEQFHLILMSQIIAKHENIHRNNNFIEILSNIRTSIRAQIRQTTDKQNLNKLFKLLTLSLNRIIGETIDNITNLDKAFNFDSSIKTTKYNYQAYPITQVKNQFIKDALRKNVCLTLMQGDQVVWDSKNSQELQQLSQMLNNEPLTEELKTDIGEKIFAIYTEQINNYLIKNNIANREEVNNLILLELTQAGVSLGATILNTGQKYLIEKLAIPTEDYMGAGILSNHKKSNILNTKDGSLVLKQPILFSPGFTVIDESKNQIAATKDINISSDLQINPNSLQNSKYENIKLSAK